MSVLTVLKTGFFRGKNLIIKHGPKIAVAIGTICVTAGTIDACVKTTHASEVLDAHNKRLDDIRKATELAAKGEVEYLNKDKNKDLAISYGQTALGFVKLYWRPTVLFVGGFASIFGGFGVLNKRHVAAVAAFTSLSDKFNEYRANVIEEYGEDADKKMYLNDPELHKAKYLKASEEDGESEEVEVDAVNLDIVDKDTFSFRFNYKNSQWNDSSFLFNEQFIETKRAYFQRRFDNNSMDHLFLSKLLEIFHFDELPEYNQKCSFGAFYGWINRPGAVVDISWEPYIEVFSADESNNQFPMEMPINIEDDDQYQMFRNMYAEDETKVGYYVHFGVDTDDRGIPTPIYKTVYGL